MSFKENTFEYPLNTIRPLMSEINTSQGNAGKFEIETEDEDRAGFGLSSGEK